MSPLIVLYQNLLPTNLSYTLEYIMCHLIFEAPYFLGPVKTIPDKLVNKINSREHVRFLCEINELPSCTKFQSSTAVNW